MPRYTLLEVWEQTRREALLELWDYVQYGTARDAQLSDADFKIAYETLDAWVNCEITAERAIAQLSK